MFSHESIEAVADAFWAGTGRLAAGLPRPIERAVAKQLPVRVEKLPAVTPARVDRFLARRRLRRGALGGGDEGSPPLRLAGLLFADRGAGIIFIRAADPPADRRFTVAHEAAHFLLDYQRPRRDVLRALGDAAAAVLDGDRPPTLVERAAAVLRGVRLGPHVHVLRRRTPAGGGGAAGDDDPAHQAVEDRADALGLELVAPRREIAAVLGGLPGGWTAETACDWLAATFGLPPDVFDGTVRRLRPPAGPPTFLGHAAAALGRRWDAH